MSGLASFSSKQRCCGGALGLLLMGHSLGKPAVHGPTGLQGKGLCTHLCPERFQPITQGTTGLPAPNLGRSDRHLSTWGSTYLLPRVKGHLLET